MAQNPVLSILCAGFHPCNGLPKRFWHRASQIGLSWHEIDIKYVQMTISRETSKTYLVHYDAEHEAVLSSLPL